MKCHHTKVEGHGKIFIPGCMGGAVYGSHRCTCDFEEERLSYVQKLEMEIERLKEENKRLKAKTTTT